MEFSLDRILGIVGAVAIPAGIGVGVAMDTKTIGELRFAQGCFISSAVILMVFVLIWGFTTDASVIPRLITVAILFCITGVGLAESLRWSQQRYDATHAQDSPNIPKLIPLIANPAPPPQPPKVETQPKPEGPLELIQAALQRTQSHIGLVPKFDHINLGQGFLEDNRPVGGAAVVATITVQNYGGPTTIGNYKLFVVLTDGTTIGGELIAPEKLIAQTVDQRPLTLSNNPLDINTPTPIAKGGSLSGRLGFFFAFQNVQAFIRPGTIIRLSIRNGSDTAYMVEETIGAVGMVH
jgi:hypothetical protein